MIQFKYVLESCGTVLKRDLYTHRVQKFSYMLLFKVNFWLPNSVCTFTVINVVHVIGN